MQGPPAFPSSPPPPPEDASLRKMTFFGAALWVTGATLGFLFIAQIAGTVHEGIGQDQFLLVGCQALSYLLALFAMLRIYSPDGSIRQFIALRKTHAAYYPLGFLLGIATSLPANWLLEQIVARWPQEHDKFTFADMFFAAPPSERIAIAIAVALIGPIVEELMFRGAIFEGLKRGEPIQRVLVASSLFFAIVHPDPRSVLPIFVLGMALGYLRHSSGSMVPSVLMHVGFNGVAVADLLSRDKAPSQAEHMPLSFALGGLLGSVVLLLLVRWFAQNQRRSDVI
jgi:uncharacterized protein